MSQPQQHRPEAVTYGDVFHVSGQLASEPIAPQDASTLQAAENIILGETPKGGPAAVMQSAADVNQRRGVVGHDDVTDFVSNPGAAVSETEIIDYRVITESIGGQDATAKLTADKAVSREDAEGVIHAEIRNKPDMATHPGGVAASMAAAARLNQEK